MSTNSFTTPTPLNESLKLPENPIPNPVTEINNPMQNNSGLGFFTVLKWVFAIIILAALGFNIFLYAKEGTDIFSKYFKQGTEKTINTANTGAEFGLDFINNSLSGLYNIFENPELKKQIEKKPKKKKKTPPKENGNQLQSGRGVKAGYCYVGSEEGMRTCVEIDKADKCLSSEIFPTMAKCIKEKEDTARGPEEENINIDEGVKGEK